MDILNLSSLTKDVLSVISSYFSYIGLYKINLECDSILKPPDFKRLIKSKLSKLGLNADSFISGLIKHKIVISGSFILQCLYGEEYEDSDIDLYMMGEKYEDNLCRIHDQYPDYKKCNGCEYTHFNDYKYEIWADLNPDKLKYEMLEYKDSYDELPIASRMYKISNAKINHIIVSPYVANTVEEFIDKYFDLNFCKVMFDGESLTIKNFDDVYNKMTHVNYQLDKYLRRAFWPEDIQSDEQLKSLIDKRIQKYRNRGFTITVD